MARSIHRGYETSPLRVGAPLPDTLPALPIGPTLEEIEAEMERGQVELMYAIARHRQAWAAMRKRAEQREKLAGQPGKLSHLDSDAIWKKRTGDVGWWRGEMEAQATTFLALDRMRELRLAAAPTEEPHRHRASCHGPIGELQCGFP